MSAPVPAPQPSTPPVEDPEQSVAAADGIREAVSASNPTFGSYIEKLDEFALRLGDMRISLFDLLIVAAIILGVVAAAWFFSRLARRAVRRLTRLDMAQRVLLEKIVTILVWTGALLIGIDLLGIDLTALAVFSGAFGLAIGFGLQKTFGNLIAGIILLMDKSIKPGDVIAVSDSAGGETFGQIRKIGVRAVSVTTRDQREYLIPNENLMINQVENWSYSSRNVRMQVPVGVSYDTDMDVAEKLMLQAADECERVLKTPPPSVWMDAYGDNSVNFVIHCWIVDPEEGVGNVRSAVLKNLWRLFKDNGIEIPYPQRDLRLRNSDQLDQLIELLGREREKRS